MERPLGPGVRKKGRNTYQVSVENYKKDKERLGPEKFKKLMDENKMKKKGMLTGGQAKIAAKAPPRNKIDAKDFAVLRKEKAKGRGMGLQDEKVQPGKVMKARVGKSITKKIPLAGKATSVGSTTMSGMKFSDKAKMVDSGKIDRATGKFKTMEAMREAKGFRPGESSEKFNKRMSKEARAAKALKATRLGKIVLPIAAAGVAAQQYLKSKMNKKKDVKKKMGGGMMQKPMGYSTGMGPETSRQAGDRSAGPATRSQRKKRLDKKLNAVGLGKLTGRQASKFNYALDKEKRFQAAGDSVESNFNAAISKRRRTGKNPFSDKKSMRKFFRELESSSTRESAARMMGGGMTKKPMGYKSGKSIKVKCKLGRNKPTKIT